jgi:4-amino-4-deoxy-L-arabinose transferase-like glycosyltransferase
VEEGGFSEHGGGMEVLESPSSRAAGRWRWRALAAFLILAVTAIRLAYLIFPGALDLAPDEAHYWDWSRHLDWSFYSKGPLVALLIRAGSVLAGPWSRELTATEMAAVRLPAVLCGALLLASLYVLTVQVYGRERLAAGVVALGITLPPLAAGASLMTIDAPYTCCWGWALVLGYQAICRRSVWAWPVAGLAVGLGILAKYTMVLWVPSLALFLLTAPDRRRLLFRPGFWIMSGVAAACCLPIVIWNYQHDWVSVRHVHGLAGLTADNSSLQWTGPLIFLGGQLGLLLGYWCVVWAVALIVHRPWRDADPGRQYLWWMSAPMFVLFLLLALKTGGGELNWPVAAYVSGLVLAAGWLALQLQEPVRWYRRLTGALLGSACAVGLALILVIHHSQWVHPLLARLAGPPTPTNGEPLRRIDPTCRLRGWRTLAAAVDRLRYRLEREGIQAELACSRWTLPGEVGFYCQGHPTVYSLGLALGDRHSQYDWWHPNPVADPERFLGRTFINVGDLDLVFFDAFARIEPSIWVTHYEGGQPVARWPLTVCHEFRGFPRRVSPQAESY